MPRLDQNLPLYGVEGQIKNKKEFINQFVPKGCKIHLLGHSVGAYMSLQLLKDDTVSDFLPLKHHVLGHVRISFWHLNLNEWKS